MAANEDKARRMLRRRMAGALIGFVVAIIFCVVYIVRVPGLRPFFIVALVVESIGAGFRCD